MTDNNDSNNNDREFNYVPEKEEERAIAKGGVSCPFPWRLHEMLKVTAEEGIDDIVSWVAHGRAFTVHKPKEFAKHVLSRYVCVCFNLKRERIIKPLSKIKSCL